jgi:hypothetical protein
MDIYHPLMKSQSHRRPTMPDNKRCPKCITGIIVKLDRHEDICDRCGQITRPLGMKLPPNPGHAPRPGGNRYKAGREQVRGMIEWKEGGFVCIIAGMYFDLSRPYDLITAKVRYAG